MIMAYLWCGLKGFLGMVGVLIVAGLVYLLFEFLIDENEGFGEIIVLLFVVCLLAAGIYLGVESCCP